MKKDLTAFEQDLHAHIPITLQMGATARELSQDRVILAAPLAPNTNHKMTAFGGSIYSIAVLSCWALVSESAKSSGFNTGYILVQNGEISYVSPVPGSFLAEASWPSTAERERFLKGLARKGIARARVTSTVTSEGKIRARLTARFVAQLTTQPTKQL